MSGQAKITFPVRKSFYGNKNKGTPVQQIKTAAVKGSPISFSNSPRVKKIIELSSESEADSDSENAIENSEPNTPTSRKNKIRTSKRQEATPPKQRKTEPSPQKTPSETFSNLVLSPSAKGKRNENFCPKQLFTGCSKLSKARTALHTDKTNNLFGRDDELKKLQEFIGNHLNKKTSGSLYVSGQPGTGKTACLSSIMTKFAKSFKTVYINCTTVKSATAIYSKIIEELKIQKGINSLKPKACIEEFLACQNSKSKSILFIFDEMDELSTKNQAVLYSIFEWPMIPKSKLIIVGIANALDLTDRLLPRLQSKCALKPELLHFAPYTKKQIMDIITERLKTANVLDMFTDRAMQLLAAKVASISGDIRRALDIARRVVELAQEDKLGELESKLINDHELIVPTPTQQNFEEKPVDFKEIRDVLSRVYGGSANVHNEESNFPMQQKLLLCSLILILNHGKNKDVTLGMLHKVYKKVCEKQKNLSLDFSEFASLCKLIENNGIVKVSNRKETRLSKIVLEWDQETVCAALQDKGLTSEIINDTSCL